MSALENYLDIVVNMQNHLKSKFEEISKLDTPEKLEMMSFYRGMSQELCLLINQINTNHFFGPKIKDNTYLLPSFDFLTYLHSYTSIRLILGSVNWVRNSPPNAKSVADQLWKVSQPLVEFVKPISNFLAQSQTCLPEIIAKAKANLLDKEQKKPEDNILFTLDTKEISSKLSESLNLALKNSISFNLDDACVSKILLNVEGISYSSQIASFQKVMKLNDSPYQIAGELLLLKFVQDISLGRHGAEVLSIFIEAAQICDLYYFQKTFNANIDMKIDTSYLNADFLTQIVGLVCETTSLGGESFLLFESGAKFFNTYWLQNQVPFIQTTRRQGLQAIFSDSKFRLLDPIEGYLAYWKKEFKPSIETIGKFIEIEYEQDQTLKAAIIWLQMFKKVTASLFFEGSEKRINQNCYSAAIHTFNWLRSKIVDFNFVENVLPLSIFREVKSIFEEYILHFAPHPTSYANIEIWKNTLKLFNFLDKDLLALRDCSPSEEKVILNYMIEYVSMLKTPSKQNITNKESFELPETADLLNFDWKASEGADMLAQRGITLKVALTGRIYVSIFLALSSTLKAPIALENMKRYLGWCDKLENFTMYDLYSIIWLNSLKIDPYLDYFINKLHEVFMNEENCFSIVSQHLNQFLLYSISLNKYIECLKYTNDLVLSKVSETFRELETALEKGTSFDILRTRNRCFRRVALAHHWFFGLQNVLKQRGSVPKLNELKNGYLELATAILRLTFLVSNPFIKDNIRESYRDLVNWDFLGPLYQLFFELIFDAWSYNSSNKPSESKSISSNLSLICLKLQLLPYRELTTEKLHAELIKRVVVVQPITSFNIIARPYEKATKHQIEKQLTDAFYNVMKMPIRTLLDLNNLNNDTNEVSLIDSRNKIIPVWNRTLEFFWKINLDSSYTPIMWMFNLVIKTLRECLAIEDTREFIVYGVKLRFLSIFISYNAKAQSFHPQIKIALQSEKQLGYIVLDYAYKVIASVYSTEVPQMFGSQFYKVMTELFAADLPNIFGLLLSKDFLAAEGARLETSPGKLLVAVLKSWNGCYEKNSESHDWRKEHLLLCMNHILAPLSSLYFVTSKKAKVPFSQLVRAQLCKLQIPSSQDEAIIIKDGDAPYVSPLTFDAELISLIASIRSSEPTLLKKLLDMDAENEWEYELANQIAKLFEKNRLNLVAEVQEIIALKDQQHIFDCNESLKPMTDKINAINKMFTFLLDVSNGKLLEFVIVHLVPQLNEKQKALTVEQLFDFLIVLAQLTKNNPEPELSNSIFVKTFKMLASYAVNIFKQVSRCYEKDSTNNTSMISDSKNLLQVLKKKSLELLSAVSKLCVSNVLINDMRITEPMLELFEYQLGRKAIDFKEIEFDSELLKFVIESSSSTNQSEKATALWCILISSLKDSFPLEAWIEATIKHEIYAKRNSNASLDTLFTNLTSKTKAILSHYVYSDIPELQSVMKNRFSPRQEGQSAAEMIENLDLSSVKNPTNPTEEVDCLELMLRFSKHPASTVINHLLLLTVRELTDMLSWNDQKVLEPGNHKGIFYLRTLTLILATYPYLVPHAFLYDLSNLSEHFDSPDKQGLLNVVESSSITRALNKDILSSNMREVKNPFGAYVIELSTMIPHQAIVELMTVFTSTALPLAVRLPTESKKYSDFNAYIQEQIEIRSVEGLKLLNASFKEGTISFEEKQRDNSLKRLISEITLGIFILNIQSHARSQDTAREVYQQLMTLVSNGFGEANGVFKELLAVNRVIQNYLLQGLGLPNGITVLSEIRNAISENIKDGVFEDSVKSEEDCKIFITQQPSQPIGLTITSTLKPFEPFDDQSKKALQAVAKDVSTNTPKITDLLIQALNDPIEVIRRVASFNNQSSGSPVNIANEDACISAFLKLFPLVEQTSIPQNNKNSGTHSQEIINTHFKELFSCVKSAQEELQIEEKKPVEQQTIKESQREEEKMSVKPEEPKEIPISASKTDKVEEVKKAEKAEEEKKSEVAGGKIELWDIETFDIYAYFNNFTSSGHSKSLQDDIAVAKRTLKLFEEEMLIDHLNRLFDPQYCFSPAQSDPISNKDYQELLDKTEKTTKILILAVATPEFICKLSPDVQSLAVEIKNKLNEVKKDIKPPADNYNYDDYYGEDDDKSHVSEGFSEGRDEEYDEFLHSLQSQPAEANTNSQASQSKANNGYPISLNMIDSMLVFPEDSSLLVFADKIINNPGSMDSIGYFLVSKTNLFRFLDSILLLAEIAFTKKTGLLPESLANEKFSSLELTRSDLFERITQVISRIDKIIPGFLLLENNVVMKHRVVGAQTQSEKCLKSPGYVLERFFNLLVYLPENSLSQHLTLFKESQLISNNLKLLVDKQQKTNSTLKIDLSPGIKPLLRGIICSANKELKTWFTEYLKIPKFNDDTMVTIESLLISDFAELSKRAEKYIPLIKSKDPKDFITAATEIVDSKFNVMLSLLDFIVFNLQQHQKTMDENLVAVIENIVYNDVVIDVTFRIYELLEKLGSDEILSECYGTIPIFHFLSMSSYHFYLFATVKDIRGEQASKEPEQEDLLEIPSTKLSRYISKEPDFGNLNALPTVTRSYSDIKRNKQIEEMLDTLFSHLTFKSQKAFQKAYKIKLQNSSFNYVLQELAKKRHWIISFKDKYEHLWYDSP